jgi:hypothetical protein
VPAWKSILQEPGFRERVIGFDIMHGRKIGGVLQFFTDIERVCDYTNHKFS